MSTLKQTKLDHEPVMVSQVEKYLLEGGGSRVIIDATLGLGGHTDMLLKRGARVLGIEADPESLAIARQNLRSDENAMLINGDFRDIKKIAEQEGFRQVDGILFDLGVSSLQLLSNRRGFSFQDETAKLDMRLNPEIQAVSAGDLLNNLRKDQLIGLFEGILGEKGAKRIAKAVVNAREKQKIETVGQFLEIIAKSNAIYTKKVNQATLPFLALRIAVNSEIENIKKALPEAIDLLKTGGRLAVISFHSGEDVVVKDFFKNLTQQGLAMTVGQKPMFPSEGEIIKNPRARSAKLRIIQKV